MFYNFAMFYTDLYQDILVYFGIDQVYRGIYMIYTRTSTYKDHSTMIHVWIEFTELTLVSTLFLLGDRKKSILVHTRIYLFLLCICRYISGISWIWKDLFPCYRITQYRNEAKCISWYILVLLEYVWYTRAEWPWIWQSRPNWMH